MGVCRVAESEGRAICFGDLILALCAPPLIGGVVCFSLSDDKHLEVA